MHRSPPLAIAFLLLLLVADRTPGADPRSQPAEEVAVFAGRTDGYHTFRIPAVIATPKGTLLAFCEGRKNGTSDTGDIDLVLKRSTDGGKTWGPLQVVVDDGTDTVGNPCPLVDRTTGRVWLPLTRNHGKNTVEQNKMGTGVGTREVLLCSSDDDGVTWSRPANVTEQVKRPDWTWYATGPGRGIQLNDGRLVIPCNHRVRGNPDPRSHVVFSDDHGKTWQIGGASEEKTNECQAVELAGGELLLNMRSHHGKNRRAVAVSKDRGASWSPIAFDEALIEPACQASLIRLPGAKDVLLFANPASTKRERMTVRLSPDGGKSWPAARVLYAGPAAYSSLVALPGEQAGCLYEKDGYKTIVFARFGPGWVADGRVGADDPSPVAPGAKVEKLAGGFQFTEGPAADAEGNVYFTDQPNDRILNWGVDGKLTTFLEPCGRSNGLCFDKEGRLWTCADEKNELWRIDVKTKEKTVVVKDHGGKLLNGPNDVWVRPDGGAYFTDPFYKRPYWKRGPQEQDKQAVYYVAPDGKLARVDDDYKQPNGIVGTPDGKTLYVADIGAGRTYAYDIQPDGSLKNRRQFCGMGSDGMTLDEAGNVYLTGKGVAVFDKAGKKVAQIDVPEPWTANVCFGGKEMKTLFITASKGLYAVQMRVKGAARQ